MHHIIVVIEDVWPLGTIPSRLPGMRCTKCGAGSSLHDRRDAQYYQFWPFSGLPDCAIKCLISAITALGVIMA